MTKEIRCNDTGELIAVVPDWYYDALPVNEDSVFFEHVVGEDGETIDVGMIIYDGCFYSLHDERFATCIHCGVVLKLENEHVSNDDGVMCMLCQEELFGDE